MPISLQEAAAVYAGKKVFVTGHSGFKGAWLALWLTSLGATVTGYSLRSPGPEWLFEAAGVEADVANHWADVRDRDALAQALRESEAEIVFHLAAEALVLESYQRPLDFFAVNVLGTAHVLDVARSLPRVRAVVVITTDKVYRDKKWEWGYREVDDLQGHDPYSASKACAELVSASYRSSFFSDAGACGVATARAGNVIGGGDDSPYRIVPDLARNARAGRVTPLRSPQAIRPWQFVLEPLAGYLQLGAALLADARHYGESWNFGPGLADSVSVQELVRLASELWPDVRGEVGPTSDRVETHALRLDSSKASLRLGWTPRLSVREALRQTLELYRCPRAEIRSRALRQIRDYQGEL